MRGSRTASSTSPGTTGAATGDQINISFSTDRGADVDGTAARRSHRATTTLLRHGRPRQRWEHLHRVRREREVPHVHGLDERRDKLHRCDCTEDPEVDASCPTSNPAASRRRCRSTATPCARRSSRGSPRAGRRAASAVVFAGTETDGNPNVGTFNASWDIYVNQSLNAAASDATFSQVKATTHPFHYDSICLNGLGCDLSVPPGDRSMADFFASTTARSTRRSTSPSTGRTRSRTRSSGTSRRPWP